MRRIAVVVAVPWLFLAASAAAQPGCPVVDGSFRHVWGGQVHNVFVYDPGPTAAWTVEDGGRVRRTRDGGVNWAFLATPPCAQSLLRGVHFLSGGATRVGWVVGDAGTVLHTTDAGLTWQTLPAQSALGQQAELWDVWFRDAQTGWLAGNHVLRKTIDGGQTWTDATLVHPQDPGFSAADVEIYAFDFLWIGNDFVGLAAAEPGILLRTDHTSGGTVWTVVWDQCHAPPLCSACLPACTATSVPALEMWDVELLPGAASLATAKAVSVGGYGTNCGQMLVSANGGLTWSQELSVDDVCNTATGACAGNGSQTFLPTQYGATAFADGTGISAGYAGSIFLRDPACSPAVWRLQPQIQGPDGPFTQPFLGADGNGAGGGAGIAWVTGLFNGLFSTTNGGTTWTSQTIANDIFRVAGIHFANAANGWAAGQFFRVQKSTDGGQTWSDQPVPQSGPGAGAAAAGNLRGIVFAPNALDGVAVGGFYDGTGRHRIVHTADGGQTWSNPVSITPALSSGERNLSSVTWTTGTDFWAVGASGIVLYAADGGANWSRITIDTGSGPISDAVLTDAAFADPNTGVVVGRRGGQGVIYVVTNATNPATRAWTDLSPPAGNGVVDFQSVAVRGTRAYVVGKKSAGGVESGVVYFWNGSAFVEDTTVPALPACDAQPSAGQGPFQKLSGLFNEVALAPTASDVFVGGSCGRFLRRRDAGWQELKSQTSFHVNGMSFVADDEGFVHASAGSHGVIVRYDSP